MERFSPDDIENLLADLQLYSGNIHEVFDVHGPHEHNGGQIGGTIRMSLDEFRFTASPMFCDKDYWTIELPNLLASLQLGHGRVMHYRVPKLHRDPELMREYQVANRIYSHYNGFMDLWGIERLTDLEALIGLDKLPKAGDVMQMIILSYRSYPQKGNVPVLRSKQTPNKPAHTNPLPDPSSNLHDN